MQTKHPVPTLTADMTRYRAADCAIFCRLKDTYGALSNMHGDFPLQLGTLAIQSSEALYQALRFPDQPALQQAILHSPSAFDAKRLAYEPAHLPMTRTDWKQGMNVHAMRAALQVKLTQHRDRLEPLLRRCAGQALVELSIRDPFWGAFPYEEAGDKWLVGHNTLGRLWQSLALLSDADCATLATAASELQLLGRPLTEHPLSPPVGTRPLF